MEHGGETPRPLLAQVPAEPRTRDGVESPGPRRETRRGRLGARIRLTLAVLFLALGVVSLVGMAHAAERTLRDGLDSTDLVLLTLLASMTFVMGAQALTLTARLPVVRRLWRRAAARRMRRLSRSVGEPPRMSRIDAIRLLPQLAPTPRRTQITRLRQFGASATWITLTALVIALGVGSAAALIAASGRSLRATGVHLGTVALAGLTLLVSYAITTMSIGLIRSWFEKRLRRPGRQLRRLLRLMLRSTRRGSALIARRLRWTGGAAVLSVRLIAGVALAAGAVSLSFVVPSSVVAATSQPSGDPPAVTGAATAAGPVTEPVEAVGDDRSSVQVTMSRVGGSIASGVADVAARNASPPTTSESRGGVSPPVPTPTTGAPGAATTTTAAATPGTTAPDATTTTTPGTTTTSTTPTTTTVPTTTTTTSPTTTTVPTTTTTTVAKTTTTTTPDTQGPVVQGVGANPNLILVGQTSVISATITDESGVGSVIVYYRLAGEKYLVWSTMTAGKGASYVATFGPFASAGEYEYRIMASDGVGNSTCRDPGTCPGGSVTVTIL